MSFKLFRDAVEKQFNEIVTADTVCRTATDPEVLWSIYQLAFPSGTNNVHIVRPVHDCNFCKQFVKQVGNIVAIKDGELISVWDIDVPYPYDVVAKQMSEYVKVSTVETFFRHFQSKVSKPFNLVEREQIEEGKPNIVTYEHLSCVVPEKFILTPSDININNNRVNTLQRGLDLIEREHLEIVLELIEENQLERGSEYLDKVKGFMDLKESYDKLDPVHKPLFAWQHYKDTGSGLYSNVIGTLIKDITKGFDLTDAVNEYNKKTNPMNFRRSKTVVTERMVDKMLAALDEHGYRDSTYRRHATVEDVAITDVLFADRTVANVMKDPLKDMLKTDMRGKKSIAFEDGKTVTLDEFITDILPGVETLSIQVEREHEGQFVNVTAPLHKDSKSMFKWKNPYAWVYNMGYADSIKQRVKTAGGKVDAFLGIRLGWSNTDDLDLSVILSQYEAIYHGAMHNIRTDGHLDVDKNRVDTPLVRDPVENIIFNNQKRIEGVLLPVYVHNFESREMVDLGFTVEIECFGKVSRFEFETNPKHKDLIHICDLLVENGELHILDVDHRANKITKPSTVWGITTNEFHRVETVMLSPNFWGENKVGQKHCFFMLEGCNNPEPVRGFFTEYLDDRLHGERKSLEILGSRMLCEPTEKQLAGIGFSDSRNGEVVCKTTGAYTGMFKIKF